MELENKAKMSKQIKAVSLISGGLDSLLSTKLLLDQGIHVVFFLLANSVCMPFHTKACKEVNAFHMYTLVKQ
jgi:tRNA U34 2-thiouridine synthase MnmA/TrmU